MDAEIRNTLEVFVANWMQIDTDEEFVTLCESMRPVIGILTRDYPEGYEWEIIAPQGHMKLTLSALD